MIGMPQKEKWGNVGSEESKVSISTAILRPKYHPLTQKKQNH